MGQAQRRSRYEHVLRGRADALVVYEFDFGSITMETHATQIDAALTPNGGQLDMRYRLDMGAVKSENHLNISIKEKEDGENNH